MYIYIYALINRENRIIRVQAKQFYAQNSSSKLRMKGWEKLQLNNIRSEIESSTGDVCAIKQYVIKFASDLRQVGGFLRVLRFPPPIKLTATM